jgi:hypothetical protein
MSKFSDNVSDSAFNPDKGKYKTTNKGPDLKIENSKNHSFNSDMEDTSSAHGALQNPNMPQLPPIFMANKKG